MLVGEPGIRMEPLTGHGISDAFCDAEPLAGALDAGFSALSPVDDALREYDAERDERKRGYYVVDWSGSRFEDWDRPSMRRLRARRREDPEQADRWVGTASFPVGLEELPSSPFAT